MGSYDVASIAHFVILFLLNLPLLSQMGSYDVASSIWPTLS